MVNTAQPVRSSSVPSGNPAVQVRLEVDGAVDFRVRRVVCRLEPEDPGRRPVQLPVGERQLGPDGQELFVIAGGAHQVVEVPVFGVVGLGIGDGAVEHGRFAVSVGDDGLLQVGNSGGHGVSFPFGVCGRGWV